VQGRGGGLQTGTLLLDPSGGTRVKLSNLGQTGDPAKLAKAMPNSQVFNAAQTRCMRAMVKPGYITLVHARRVGRGVDALSGWVLLDGVELHCLGQF
jgi:hypothetical protein